MIQTPSLCEGKLHKDGVFTIIYIFYGFTEYRIYGI